MRAWIQDVFCKLTKLFPGREGSSHVRAVDLTSSHLISVSAIMNCYPFHFLSILGCYRLGLEFHREISSISEKKNNPPREIQGDSQWPPYPDDPTQQLILTNIQYTSPLENSQQLASSLPASHHLDIHPMASEGDPPLTTWQPASIFSTSAQSHAPIAIIILNQALSLPACIYAQLWARSTVRVAADGGANQLHALNTARARGTTAAPLGIDAVIGDLDSLRPDARRYWEEERRVPVIRDPDQGSTDFTKAMRHVRAQAAALDVVVLGGVGGRVDQGMATLSHLYAFQLEGPAYAAGRMYLLSRESVTFVLRSGRHRIMVKGGEGPIRLGRHVGIIPLREPSVVTTRGLEWDVADWETAFGGQMSTSNHVREEEVEVDTTKDVLFTIDLEISVPNPAST